MRKSWLVLALIFQSWRDVCSDDWLKSILPVLGTTGHLSYWHELRENSTAGYVQPVCNEHQTSINLDGKQSTLFLVNFQPANAFSSFALSFCKNDKSEDCYVAEIFGLSSGRLGYDWKKVSPKETGAEQWVPGKNRRLHSKVIKSDNAVRNGTWDADGKTVYQFYVDMDKDVENPSAPNQVADLVRIRYNGGSAGQQKEMTFSLDCDDQVCSGKRYDKVTVASLSDPAKVYVEGTKGCFKLKQVLFKPGQDMRLFWGRPSGSIGLSLCTEDIKLDDCYVLDIVGVHQNKLNYSWRRHSLTQESGSKGWVPGKAVDVNGIVIAQEPNGPKSMEPGSWKDAASGGVTLFIRKSIDGKLSVRFGLNKKGESLTISDSNITLDIPIEFQFTTIGNRAVMNGKPIYRANIVAYGPCFNGEKFGYITQMCQRAISPRDPKWPKDTDFHVYSPKPGVAESVLESPVLESKAKREQLCVSLNGITSERGASITVTAEDASGKSNQTVHVGELTYNRISPPEWQRVGLSIDLPTNLQNVPLKVKLSSKRSSADSFVLLSEAKLCSHDGCGIPTPQGVANIAFGEETSAAKFPWHVGIFSKDQNHYKYICGGTLVRSDVVLSAAHCYVDDRGKRLPKNVFKLAVGKLYNTLLAAEPSGNNQQFSDALEIHFGPRYIGVLNNHENDIAVVRVNFTLSSLVIPACLDWFQNSLQPLQIGNIGEVPGWGTTENNALSQKLLFAKLPYVPYQECINTIPKTFVPFVTQDKFCAGIVNGSTVKQGDSGGGLVFQTGGLWYLRGIVSTGVPGELTYTTFTDVGQFIPWIKQVLKIVD